MSLVKRIFCAIWLVESAAAAPVPDTTSAAASECSAEGVAGCFHARTTTRPYLDIFYQGLLLFF